MWIEKIGNLLVHDDYHKNWLKLCGHIVVVTLTALSIFRN